MGGLHTYSCTVSFWPLERCGVGGVRRGGSWRAEIPTHPSYLYEILTTSMALKPLHHAGFNERFSAVNHETFQRFEHRLPTELHHGSGLKLLRAFEYILLKAVLFLYGISLKYCTAHMRNRRHKETFSNSIPSHKLKVKKCFIQLISVRSPEFLG